MQAGPADHILDIGSGIGGPARYFANALRLPGHRHRSDTRVLRRRAPSHALARSRGQGHVRGRRCPGDAVRRCQLRRRLLDERVDEHRRQRRASTARFTACSSRAPGWCCRSSPRARAADLDYPTPWARSARDQLPVDAGGDAARPAGGRVRHLQLHSTLDKALAFGARSRAMVERGEKPPHRAVMLIHGEIATQAMANTSRGLADGKIVPIEVLSRKRL